MKDITCPEDVERWLAECACSDKNEQAVLFTAKHVGQMLCCAITEAEATCGAIASPENDAWKKLSRRLLGR